ncbi:MAG: BatD family protein [Xanthomonadales bacterium]|nr:BatD family protein [Xanthomonadales bacterium]
MMNKLGLKSMLLYCLIFSVFSAVAEDRLQTNINISVQQQNTIWIGQQVTLNLDLKTTGYGFTDAHFNLPEVAGAFLMQTDTTTIKLTEQIDGVSWQIIRYPLALYPQQAGQLLVPPITVRFNSAAGFNSEIKAFEFQTQALQINIKNPPGVAAGDLVITTTDFDLDYQWQAETSTTKTGDAFTLTINRSAGDISAMLLPPIPVYRVEGLAAYPQAPEVKDKTNRGDLSGERSDSIIWVAEKPGTYKIPAIRFQWWDPASEVLKQQLIPGLELEVQPAAVATGKFNADGAAEGQPSLYKWYLLAGILITILTAVFWRRLRHTPADSLVASEKTAFGMLSTACQSNMPVQVYAALNHWLVCCSPTSRSLQAFAKNQADPLLSAELLLLQETLVLPQDSWRGSELLRALKKARDQLKQADTEALKTHLQSLNPA